MQRFAAAAARHESAKLVAPEVALREMQQEPEFLRRQYETAQRPSTYIPVARRIMKAVAREFGVSVDDLTSPSRQPVHVIPRYVAIALFLELTRMSFGSIGKQLGGRDHSTIFQAQPKIKKLLDSEAFRNRVDQIKEEISHG